MAADRVRTHVIGLISDTHGQLRPGVFEALAGAELILHAGDVGSDVLEELSVIAPVRAVAGNTDAPDDPRLELEIACEVGGTDIHVSHGHELGRPTPAALLARYAGDVLVFGHTHRALIVRDGARVVVNPGAAGPSRFGLPASVGRMVVGPDGVDIGIIPLGA